MANPLIQLRQLVSSVISSATALGGALTGSLPNPGLAIPAWTALVYSNSWADLGAGCETGAWWKDSFGVVHLRGAIIRTGTPAGGETIATLPVGARPLGTQFFIAGGGANYATLVRVDVPSTGAIAWQGTAVASATVSLDGITFRTT